MENGLERNKTRKRKWKWRDVGKFKMSSTVRMDGVRNRLWSVGWGKGHREEPRGFSGWGSSDLTP